MSRSRRRRKYRASHKHRETRRALLRFAKQILHDRQGGVCAGCQQHFPVVDMTVDHLRALAHDGNWDPANLQMLCHNCNRIKSRDSMHRLWRVLDEMTR